MNIFVLDVDPVEAALRLYDKHIVKMATESAQILSTVVRVKLGTKGDIRERRTGELIRGYAYCLSFEKPDQCGIYLATHINHKCVKWAGTSFANFSWLLMHGEAICNIYGNWRGRVHGAQEALNDCRRMLPLLPFETEGLTPFVLAMPDSLRIIGDPVEAYRTYYTQYKSHIKRPDYERSWRARYSSRIKTGT